MTKPIRTALLSVPLCAACGGGAPPQTVARDPWGVDTERLFQARELIRYVDEEQRLRRRELRTLGIETQPITDPALSTSTNSPSAIGRAK